MKKSETKTSRAIPKPSRSTAGALLRDPALFARIVLGADLWKTQREILTAVGQHSRVAVKACHASGKSYAIAIAVLWWLTAHRDGIVVTTAPTWLQVEKVIWGEIKSAVLRSGLCGKLKFPLPTQTELRLGPQNYAIGLSTDDSSRFQGFHSGHVLIVLDEAPGVRAEVYEAVEGIRAGGQVRVLALGNPTVAGGPFYDAFTANRAAWRTLTINAIDTPNLEGLPLETLRLLPKGLSENDSTFEYRPRPYLVTRRWVYEKPWEWGEDSALWQSRVLGSFPEQAQDSLISLKWLEMARRPKLLLNDEAKLYAGIDVAKGGEDETACAVRTRAGRIVASGSWHGDSTGHVVQFLTPYKSRLREVNYDSAGPGEYYDTGLAAAGFRNLVPLNVGASTDYPERFKNLKAQLYWGLRERFKDGQVSGLDDDLAITQLASIRYEINPRGLIEIESKDEMKKRGLKSPDRAEALMLCFANRTPGIMEFYQEKAERPALEAAHQKATAEALAKGETPPPPLDPLEDGSELQKAYDEIQQFGPGWDDDEIAGTNVCAKCGGALEGTVTDAGPLGRYHPGCFRGQGDGGVRSSAAQTQGFPVLLLRAEIRIPFGVSRWAKNQE